MKTSSARRRFIWPRSRPRWTGGFASRTPSGTSLHAGVRIHEHDREGLERLCRHAVHPPFALQRLSQGEDGQLVYRMKRPRGGALFLLLEEDVIVGLVEVSKENWSSGNAEARYAK